MKEIDPEYSHARTQELGITFFAPHAKANCVGSAFPAQGFMEEAKVALSVVHATTQDWLVALLGPP